MADDRFKYDPQEFVGVVDPKLVYVGVDSRTAFDLLAVPCVDSGDQENGRVLTKTIQNADGVMVIFQHWLKSLTVDGIRALHEEKARAGAEA